ncbi:MAG: 2-amino-4-hydroxy-6-hydroxymethyldihydropteridine diphosphokinase [Spirochaetales bacterium]|nr:2-amino-4-hydroxy-6-hydroxymethyldihydropteridine diphosphokinase [Spirochaetales bacterium]
MNALKKAKVFLSLGTNMGNRKKNLQMVYTQLSLELSSLRISPLYETLPLYVKDQPEFLNCVVSGETGKSPYELLDYVLDLEQTTGRTRTNSQNKGPRVIDIDILLYNKEIINQKQLQIPHPGMYERQFVLIPLLELEPDLQDPVSGHPFSFFLEGLNNQGVNLYTEKGTYTP